MIISPLYRQVVTKNPNFLSCYRSYSSKAISEFGAKDNQYVRTSTNLFREDLDWNSFVKFLVNHFVDKDRVMIYSMACSDGSEAYSLAIFLMEKFSKSLCKKFFPIMAHDVDDLIINSAKSERINIEDCEIYYINKLGINLNKYFVNPKRPLKIKNDMTSYNNVGLFSYEPIQELKQTVEFKKSDILTELNKIKDNGNSVVMCRNVMPYLKEDYIDEIVSVASKVLKDGSFFVTGDYDSTKKIGERLEKSGFYRPLLENQNLFQKGNSKEMIDRLLYGYLI